MDGGEFAQVLMGDRDRVGRYHGAGARYPETMERLIDR